MDGMVVFCLPSLTIINIVIVLSIIIVIIVDDGIVVIDIAIDGGSSTVLGAIIIVIMRCNGSNFLMIPSNAFDDFEIKTII